MKNYETPIMAQFQKALEKVVSDFAEADLTFGEAIGIFEIVKLNIYAKQNEANGDEPEENKF